MKPFLLGAALALSASVASAGELVTKMSPHSVGETMDRLVAAVEKAGAGVAARVNHAAAAEKAGLELKPIEALIFGNPKIGTPIMAENPQAGLDLPIRVVVYEDADGKTVVAYRAPADLAAEHGLPADMKSFMMMGGALDKLTGAAIAE